jgi:hypothetical protein
MDIIFKICVYILHQLAYLFGTSYEAINVIIFCIIEPLIFMLLIIYIFHLRKELKKYQR